VPRDKRERRAAAYEFDDEERLLKRTTWSGVVVAERPEQMPYESGGQGLWSTVDDYLSFARLFLGDGSVDGVRLLHPETMARMMTDQLNRSVPIPDGYGRSHLRPVEDSAWACRWCWSQTEAT
jgi:CubicO group peptidase (beta-lactamase class C family)